jgi:hypothetical protein
MDFIKKNWEKVLLGVVLVGLAVAVGLLPMKIKSERDALAQVRTNVLNPQIKPLAALKLESAESALKHAETPSPLDLSSGHRLLNPVPWQKTADNRLLKIQTGNEIGPAALVVVKTTPLYVVISLDGVVTNETGARYAIGIERQGAERAGDRRKRQVFASLDEAKTDSFTLQKVNGPAGQPSEVIVELADSGETASLTRDKPYRRVDGYLADLKYGPEAKTWANRRVGDKLAFGGENYNIVAINPTEVVVSARSGKKTTARMPDTSP